MYEGGMRRDATILTIDLKMRLLSLTELTGKRCSVRLEEVKVPFGKKKITFGVRICEFPVNSLLLLSHEDALRLFPGSAGQLTVPVRT